MPSHTTSTKALYDKRANYYLKTEAAPLDRMNNWAFDDFVYCRVNENRRIITPLEVTAATPFPPPADGTIFALDFVVDAFTEMSNYYSSNMAARNIRGLKGLRELKPTKGYKKSVDLYLSHTESLKDILFNKYLVPNRDEILTFQDYMKQFMKFIWAEAPNIPVLYSSFVYSPYCPMHSTGLVVEVAEENHNLNNYKYDLIFDQNFEFFANMATSFGFVIARHAPWMFVANLDSSEMHKYAMMYNIANPDIFKIMDQYFYECKDFDIDLLRQLMYDSYYEFSIRTPARTDLSICKGKTQRTYVQPGVLTIQEINSMYTKYDWMDLYFRVLIAEQGKDLNPQRYGLFFEQCKKIYDIKGFDTAIDFLEMRILKTREDIYR